VKSHAFESFLNFLLGYNYEAFSESSAVYTLLRVDILRNCTDVFLLGRAQPEMGTHAGYQGTIRITIRYESIILE
jgi:hypothetical protein